MSFFLPHIKKYISYPDEFLRKVKSIATKLKVNENWLLAVMYNESRFNPKAVHKRKGDAENAEERSKSRATGLIQFMPETAKGLDTSTRAVYKLSALDQLDFVYKYFAPFAGKINTFTDLYLITFFPAAIGKADTYVFSTKTLPAEKVAQYNAPFDLNKDQKITVAEFKSWLKNHLPSEIWALIGSTGAQSEPEVNKVAKTVLKVAVISLLLTGSYFGVRYIMKRYKK